MTNEEAIKFLSQIMDAILVSNSWLPSTDNPIKESFGMAINALKAQEQLSNNSPKLDSENGELISRHNLEKQLKHRKELFCRNRIEFLGLSKNDKARVDEIDNCIATVINMQSAQPEIIRCKDCIFHGLCRTSPKWAVAPKDDWYCADAERRTDDR